MPLRRQCRLHRAAVTGAMAEGCGTPFRREAAVAEEAAFENGFAQTEVGAKLRIAFAIQVYWGIVFQNRFGKQTSFEDVGSRGLD